MKAVAFQDIVQVKPVAIVLLLCAGFVFADDPADERNSQPADRQQPSAQADRSAQRTETPIERGKYLVHHVAMCVQCHTPRDEQGNLKKVSLLQGSAIPVASPFSEQHWAFKAPQLAGLPAGFQEEDLVRLLRTGKGPRGNSPKPPMPPFRMTKQDAQAVAAYLKSIR